MQVNNYGLIESSPVIGDILFGSADRPILVENGDWRPYVYDFELQKNPFETWRCVTESSLNSDQLVINRKYNIKVQFSKRYTAKMSGTIMGVGNTFLNVAKSKKTHGVIEEVRYANVTTTVEEYYKEIEPDITRRATMIGEMYDTDYSWIGWGGVSHRAIHEALPFGPVQISIRAWKKPNLQGVYDYYDTNTNHAVLALYSKKIGEDAYLIYILDSYYPFFKILSPQFYIRSAMQHYVEYSNDLRLFHFAALFKEAHGRLPKWKELSAYFNDRNVFLTL